MPNNSTSNEPFWEGGNPVATVYLRRSGDEKNKMMLLENALVVRYKGREYIFERPRFQGLEVGYRKYLLPLIAGGIILPLSFLAMATNDFNPFFLILFLLAGFYLLYAGWSGSPVLSVLYDPKPFDFTIFHISDNLKAFISFTNAFLSESMGSEEQRRYIFLVVEKDLWKRFKEPEPGLVGGPLILPAKTWEQWQRGDREVPANRVALVIDLFKIKTKVVYEYSKKNHQLEPRVEWPVNEEAVFEYNSI